MIMLLKDLRLSPIRSFLTGFSMFIGILAVIASVLIGTVGKEYLVATNEQLNGRKPTYAITFLLQNFDDYIMFEKFLHAVESSNHEASVVLHANTHLVFTDSIPVSKIVETDADALRHTLQYADAMYATSGYDRVYNLPIVQGRWFSNNSKNNALEMVVNQAASQRYRVGEVAFATSQQTTQMSPIQIVGVVNDGQNSAKIYVNILGLLRFAPGLWNSSVQEAQGTIYWLNRENRPR